MMLLEENVVSIPYLFKCSNCGGLRKKLAVVMHVTGVCLYLCFLGCTSCPKVRRDAVEYDWTSWVRVDPWVAKKRIPKLRKKNLRKEDGLLQ